MNDSSDRKVIKFPKETVADIERDAAEWLMRIAAGSPSVGDIVECGIWRAGSAERDRIYGELEQLWSALGKPDSAKTLVGAARASDCPLPQRKRIPWFPGLDARIVRLAAGCAAAFVGVVAVMQYASVWRYDYHTAARQIQQLTLADGTRVTMKGDTALNVYISDTGPRKVELARGEAYFEVVHDAARPFVVDMGSGHVKDIGTGFSVERHGEVGRVRVEHGEVEVVAAGQSQNLVRGQQIGFGLYRMGLRSAVATDMISAWRRGLYIAENKTVGEVLADLGEYHPGKIVLLDEGLRTRRINAVVRLGDIDAWLDTLGEASGASVSRWGPFVLVKARPV